MDSKNAVMSTISGTRSWMTLLLLFGGFIAGAQTGILIEAESFPDKGGCAFWRPRAPRPRISPGPDR